MYKFPLKIEVRHNPAATIESHRYLAFIIFDKANNNQMGVGNCGSTLEGALGNLMKRNV